MKDCSSYAPWYNHKYYITSVRIESGVTSIGNYAFHFCSNIESIVVSDSVTNIGNYAFNGCSSLTSIQIPDSVTSIGNYAFNGCSSLTSIQIPDSVTSIGNYAFNICSSLESIVIPDSVINIGTFAFKGCSNLCAITIGSGVTKICEYTFYSCSKLSSIKLPDSITSIDSGAFRDCISLTSLIVPNSVTSIGNGAFSGCGNLTKIELPFVGGNAKNSSETYQYPFGYIFGSINYSGCTLITQRYYGSNINNTTSTSYYIPQNLQSVTITGGDILYGAFYNCNKLVSVTLDKDVKSISSYAFYECNNLKSITIPKNVTSIEDDAFYGCDNLSIYCFKGSSADLYAQEKGISVQYLHDHEYIVTETIPASCIEPGEVKYVCSTCGDSYKERIPLIEHSYVLDKVYEVATCTDNGISKYICFGCDDSKFIELPALGHDYIKHEAKAATCTEIGYAAYENCTRCNYTTYSGDIPVLSHSMEETIITNPTTCTVGQLQRKCTTCGHTEYEEIPMLEIVQGDLDGDGVVSVKDVLVTIKAVLNGTALDGADMNGDGKLSLIDVLRVLKAITA